MSPIKPGWQTTEFWAPIITLAVSALVAFHAVPSADSATVMGYATSAVTNIVAISGSVVLIWRYIESRIEAKAHLREAEERRLP